MAWSVGRLVGRSVVPKSSCNRRLVELNVAAQLPLKARVGGSGEGAQSRATLGGDGYEGTCKMGATVAACAGDLGARRESSGDRGLGDGKGPSGHDGGYSDGGGGQLGGRARGHHFRYGRGLDPPRTMLRSQREILQVRWTTPRRLTSPSACSARSGVQRDT